MQGIITVPGQLALLREGIGGSTWSGARIALLVDTNPFSVGDTVASHTEASYTGYARQSLSWGSTFYDAAPPPGPDLVAAVVNQWNGPAAAGNGQTITGWALIQASESGSVAGSSGQPLLLAAGPLDAPITLNGPNDSLPLVVNLDSQFQAAAVTQS